MLQINYNQFTDSELERIFDCARALNFIFGQQFPGLKRQLKLLEEDEQFRAINQTSSNRTTLSLSASSVKTPRRRVTRLSEFWMNNPNSLSLSPRFGSSFGSCLYFFCVSGVLFCAIAVLRTVLNRHPRKHRINLSRGRILSFSKLAYRRFALATSEKILNVLFAWAGLSLRNRCASGGSSRTSK